MELKKEDKALNKRSLVVLIFEIFIIIVAIGGLTFATNKLLGSNTIITFGEYNVDYVGKTSIEATDLEPISDKLININTKDNVIRLEFSLRGVDTNGDENLIYDVMINQMNIDCSLLNEYTKWNLYKNELLLYQGNFSPKFDETILKDNYRLTEIQQDLPKYNEDYDKYVLIIWISESCEDITNCTNYVDQSDILDSVMDMNVFIAISGGEKVTYQRVKNETATCVNKPVLEDNMLPVYYQDGDWKLADVTNNKEPHQWYDYGNSKWANVVFVNTDKYQDSNLGTKIEQSDIIAYYVWIPRYKYKLWNNGTDLTDSYDALNKGIDIVFESGTHSTGKVNCNDTRCNGKVNQYLTHPAFKSDLRGFWVSKYELGIDNKFIPNIESLKNKTFEEYQTIITNLTNTYQTTNSTTSIINNLEWGAITYLSHSKYGLCQNNTCQELGNNQTTISESNKQDTTTRNIYGVYDMSGGTAEYATASPLLGTATYETRTNESTSWYQGTFIENGKDYILRGGRDTNIYSTSDIGMIDTGTRSILTVK